MVKQRNLPGWRRYGYLGKGLLCPDEQVMVEFNEGLVEEMVRVLS